jgi:hypothetical protein
MPEDKKGYTINDQRFSAPEGKESDIQTEKDPKDPLSCEKPNNKSANSGDMDESKLPEINFMTFVMSLNASAMVHLGMIEDPGSGEISKNLTLGKQTIDILGILEQKTKGNLSRDEENMLKDILYDLRILYVKEKS